MLEKNLSIKRVKISTSVVIGGIIGIITASLYKFRILNLYGIATIFNINSIDPIITGVVLGIVIGAIIGGVIKLLIFEGKDHQYYSKSDDVITKRKMIYDTDNGVKMQLREEQLDILKKEIKTGDINIHKEIITEEKNITVPVNREELVIEKTIENTRSNEKGKPHKETIRIPISEERVDINKHQVILEEVYVYRNQFEEIKHITETLKKEIEHINTSGDVKIIDEKDSSKQIKLEKYIK